MGRYAYAGLYFGVVVKDGYRTNPFWWSNEASKWDEPLVLPDQPLVTPNPRDHRRLRTVL